MLPTYRVYVTRNHEYHLHDDFCVAVRDRRSGEWQKDHDAVFQRATHMVFPTKSGWRKHAVSPRTGSRLYFGEAAWPVMSSTVKSVRESTDEERAAYRELDCRTRTIRSPFIQIPNFPEDVPTDIPDKTGKVSKPASVQAAHHAPAPAHHAPEPRRAPQQWPAVRFDR